MARYLYSELSSLIQARQNCLASPDTRDWLDRHEAKIEELVKDHMPSGSGFDSGTQLDLDASHADKLVFTTGFHHTDENGYYCGWTEHTVKVTPSLASDFYLRITGRNRNTIKEYMYETFRHCLMTDVEWDVMRDWPRVQALNLAIKHEWLDQSRQRWFVTGNDQELYTPPTDSKYYAGTPIEQCKAFCVQFAQSH